MMTNCVNCGAPITGSRCEYCGTPTDAQSDEPRTVTTFYADGAPYISIAEVDQHAIDLFEREIIAQIEARRFLYG